MHMCRDTHTHAYTHAPAHACTHKIYSLSRAVEQHGLHTTTYELTETV